MNTQIGNNNTGEPNLLDGSPACPGQNLEGNPYLKFLTLDEYMELDTMEDRRPGAVGPKYYKHDTPTDRVKRMNRFLELIEKLDLEYISQYYDNRIKEIKHLKTKKVNRYELGAREFTFTYSPKWFDDATARLQMSIGIQKLIKTYNSSILKLRAVGEVGTNGLSHIHCFYQLKDGTKITDKNFSRAYKMWNTKIRTGPTGHQGGHHANVKVITDFLGYIDKDIENSWFDVNIDNSEKF